MPWRRPAIALALLAAALSPVSATAQTQPKRPEFLPEYYRPALVFDGRVAAWQGTDQQKGVDRATYATADRQVAVEVWRVACDRPRCEAVMRSFLENLNAQIASRIGAFEAVSNVEIRARVSVGLTDENVFAFKLPNSVLFWILRGSIGDANVRHVALRAAVDRQRYEEARAEGNVALGLWGAAILEHARRLAASGQKEAALRAYADLLATSPTSYEGHLEYASLADRAAAMSSADIVLRNAEDGALRRRAAQIAGAPAPGIEDVPPLETSLSGLQFVFIPLPPCDVSLVEEAAAMFQRIVDAPAKIRRLPENWTFAAPDRFANQRQVQQFIIQLRRANVDFFGWTMDRYLGELIAAANGADPYTKFVVRDYAAKLAEAPGQYDADPYYDRLIAALAPHRSKDPRVVYVGVTEANIYSGDSNYVFSVGGGDFPRNGSLLSYAMMMARNTGEPTQSRKRLVERLAKEMTPAALKPLGVPRPADPSDPYSYSSGVSRLDEKSLMLSPQVRQALDRFR